MSEKRKPSLIFTIEYNDKRFKIKFYPESLFFRPISNTKRYRVSINGKWLGRKHLERYHHTFFTIYEVRDQIFRSLKQQRII